MMMAKKKKNSEMDLLKFKLEISGAVVASPSANRSIVDEENAIDLVSPPVKKSKYYNPYAQIPCHDKWYDMYGYFSCVDDIPMPR
ncbi:hypothetical protein NPIL_468261 [Nephila pilipes]|uniref:Uncharacterized protein n=1 Tax=Nephila pilipes TaxID=299642 RepID=A0A8X6PDJ9_NEPPI|nr:hypothetical protein NPIL_468261 [Nephila pilipes]